MVASKRAPASQALLEDHDGTRYQSMPQPGQVVVHDFRDVAGEVRSSAQPLRVVTWNIERGYKLTAIIDTLRGLDADVIALQEIDIGCERSGYVDVGVAIARSLGMNYAYATEFVEFWHSSRKTRDQGGGVHGNAILTRFDMRDVQFLAHEHQPFHWERDGHTLSEPRRGARGALVATIDTHQGPMMIYCLHLELFCGMLDRVRVISEVFAHAAAHQAAVPNQMIAGDLNTLAHGIARLSPKFCRDRLRFTSWGLDEAEWWDRYLLDVQAASVPRNPYLAGMACFPDHVVKAARNPGFHEPWSASDTTLIDYHGLFRGKLDWLLMTRFQVQDKAIGNMDFSASDHRLLFVQGHWAPPGSDFTLPGPRALPMLQLRRIAGYLAILVAVVVIVIGVVSSL